MSNINNEVLNEVNEEDNALADAFDKLYVLMKHLMSEEEYNVLVAKALLHDTNTGKQ